MIRNITNTFFTRVIHSAITLLMVVIISRFLGAEVKGQQGLILSTISLLHIVMNVVGTGAIVYLIPRFSYSRLCTASYLWLLLTAVVFYLLSSYLIVLPVNYTAHITLLSVIFTLSGFHVHVLIAREKIILANTIVLIQILIQLAALTGAIFLFNERSVYAYIYALYISQILSYVYALVLSHRHVTFNRHDLSWQGILSGVRLLMRYGFFNQMDIFAQVLSFRFSYYLLALYLGNKEVGVYSIAVSVAESIWLIARSISMVFYARVSNNFNPQKNAQTTIMVIKASTLLTLIALMVILLVPASVYPLVFGKEFYEIKSILYYFAPGILFFSASFLISSYFSGSGKQHINTIASFAGFIVTIVFAFILIPPYGFIGAAITASLSYSVTTLTKLLFFQHQQPFPIKAYLLTKHDIRVFRQMIGVGKK